ncbi:hypothetical protein RJT34_05172 [Clitoria ternatea]|uniref:Uncharacterized protein n=1 Tax=Clitoria ternatea TaxID=43366 RepID=A0AAN9PSU2_CLITE
MRNVERWNGGRYVVDWKDVSLVDQTIFSLSHTGNADLCSLSTLQVMRKYVGDQNQFISLYLLHQLQLLDLFVKSLAF